MWEYLYVQLVFELQRRGVKACERMLRFWCRHANDGRQRWYIFI